MYAVEALFFPTTVIIIDDDQDFLLSMRLALQSFFSLKAFNDPRQALDYMLTNQPSFFLLDADNFTKEVEEEGAELSLDIEKIHQLAKNKQKQQLPTVIISDHDMPEMTGIELFERLDKTSFKRILLTGKADLKLALDAFNRKLVDHFLVKNTEKMLDEILASIRACQRSFFSAVSYPVLARLNLPADSLLRKEQFSVDVMSFIKENDVIAYYLIDTVGSFLMQKSDGQMLYFTCLLERQFDDYLRFATASRAPKEVLDALKNRTHAPVFISREDEKLPAEEWGDILHSFEKKDGYYLSPLEK